MKLVRRYDEETGKVSFDKHDGLYWKDTVLGKYIINELGRHFAVGNNVPTDGTRFTAVTKDGMLYFNDNAEELKAVLHLVDRWIPQEELNLLIDQDTDG